MKKIIFTLKSVQSFWNGIGFLLILVSILLQSCAAFNEVTGEIRASLDGTHQTYAYNRGPNIILSPNSQDIGLNVAYSLLTGRAGARPNSGAFNNSNQTNLYASNNQMLVTFDNNSEKYKVETVKSIQEKKSSDFLNHLRFMGGIEFVQKNSKDGGSSISLIYIQIPTFALYFYELPKTGSIFGGLGPYFAYGIGGKIKSSSFERNSFDSITGFKPFDAGLSLTGGYKMTNSFSFSLAYDIGLANISRSTTDKVTNSGISLNVSYPVNLLFKKSKSASK
jgi:hypothetical protein